jgi:hypothetical protein
MPALVAVASLYTTIILLGIISTPPPRPSSSSRCCAWYWCSRLREVSTQLTSARLTAVVDVIFRWLVLLAVLLAIGYVTKSLQAYPRRMCS